MRRALLFLLAALALPQALPAQSLFSTRGLGVPIEPLDARARALGGIGVGLLGVNPSLVSPAELGGLRRRGVSAALQPTSHDQTLGGEQASVSATRFPLLGIIYPLGQQLTVGVGYGGYLEQSWGIRETGSIAVDDRSVAYEDLVRASGGLGQIRVSAAYMLTPTLSLGATGGVMTGNVDRTITRTFDDTTATLRNFSTRVVWEYSGLVGGLGARYDVNPALRVGASVTVTGDIDADSAAGTAASRSYGGALQLAAGASGRVSPDLMVALGAVRHRYPDPAGDLVAGRDTWTLGGGLEYEGLRTGRRVFPLRLGARLQELPYHGSDEEPAKEISGTLGIGLRLASDQSGPLAVVDVGVERAKRTGLESSAFTAGLEDSLWRFTFSLSLFGR